MAVCLQKKCMAEEQCCALVWYRERHERGHCETQHQQHNISSTLVQTLNAGKSMVTWQLLIKIIAKL